MADPQPQANFTPPPGTPDTFANPTAPFLNPGQPQQAPDMASTFGVAQLAPGFVRDASGHLTMDGRPPDRFMPDPNAPPGAGSVPQWDVTPPRQQQGPLAIPPEADQLIKVIEAHELTPGRSEWQLYGGQTFTPGAKHPKDMGWGGDRGPDGRPTSGAGPGQWQRDTWRDEAKKIAALGVEPNFGDMAQQRWAMWDLGSRTYQARTGRDLRADIQAGKADWQALGSVWQGLQSGVSPHLVSGSYNAPAQGLVDEIMRNMQAQQPGMNEAISEAKDLHSMARSMAAKWMSDSDKPPQNMRQAWSQWGTVAGALALFGGLFGHGHMVAALNAAGEMLQSANSADQHAYDTAYKHWEDHLNNGIKAIEMLNKEAMDIIADSKLGYDQQVAQLQVLSTAAGLQKSLDPNSVDNQTKNLELIQRQNDIIKANNLDATKRLAVDAKDQAWLKEHPGVDQVPPDVHLRHQGDATREASGFLPGSVGKPGTEQEFAYNAIATKEAELGRPLTTQERSDVEAKAHADWAKARTEGTQEAGYDLSQKIYGDETIGMVADSFIAGNDHSMVGMARGNTGQYAMARVWKAIGDKLSVQEAKEFQEVYGRPPDAEEKKVLDEDRGRRLGIAIAEFKGIQAGEKTAFTRAAGLVTAAAEAKQFTPQALETSAKLSRTEFPTLNRIEAAVKEHTGNKDVVDFYVANTSLADAYAQVIGRGNAALTDAARNQAMSMLNQYWSEGQYETAVSRINKEIDAAQKAPEEVVKRFREGFLQRQSAAPTAGVGAVQPGGQATPQSAPAGGVVIQNGWRYDAKTHAPLGPVQ